MSRPARSVWMDNRIIPIRLSSLPGDVAPVAIACHASGSPCQHWSPHNARERSARRQRAGGVCQELPLWRHLIGAGDAGLSGPDRSAEPPAGRLRACCRGSGHCHGTRHGRSICRRHRRRAADGGSDRHQGPHRRGGHADARRHQARCGGSNRSGGTRRTGAAARRLHNPRQNQDRRVRAWHNGAVAAPGDAGESVGRRNRSPSRRVEFRLGSGDCRRLVRLRPGLRHRRLRSRAGGAEWSLRPEDQLRCACLPISAANAFSPAVP